MSVHKALSFRQWPPNVLFFAGDRQLEPQDRAQLDALDVPVIHWIVEGKRDGEMTSPIVIAKGDTAAAWVKTVNASDEAHETWAYLLASESVCGAAGSWEAVKAGGQVFQ